MTTSANALLRRTYADGAVDTDIPGWSLRCLQTSSGALGGGAREVHTSHVQLLEEHYCHVTTNHYGVARPDAIGFVLAARLAEHGTFNGQSWVPTQMCVWNTNREFNAMTPPSDLLVAIVDRPLLARHVVQTEQLDIEPALHRASLVFEAPATAIVQRLGALIRGAFDEGCDPSTPAARQAIHQEVLETLAPLVVAHLDRDPAPRSRFSHLTNVRRAREVALSQPDTPLQIQDLCSALQVSRRTLQDSFQTVLGVSPLHYLRALRLDGARRDLLKGHSVKDVVETWGFWHWSRFSQDYRRLFGELPSATLRRVAPLSATAEAVPRSKTP